MQSSTKDILPKKKSSIRRFFIDLETPLALRLVLAFLLLAVIVLTLIFAYNFFTAGPSRIPRSIEARNIILAEEHSGDALAAANQLLTLLDAGDLRAAEKLEEEFGRENIDFAPLLYARSQLKTQLASREKDETLKSELEKNSEELLIRAATQIDTSAGEYARVIYREYAELLFAQGDKRKAFDFAQLASAIKPAGLEDYLLLGTYAEAIGDYYEASLAYLTAEAFDSQNSEARAGLERMKSQQNERLEAAKKAFNSDESRHGF